MQSGLLYITGNEFLCSCPFLALRGTDLTRSISVLGSRHSNLPPAQLGEAQGVCFASKILCLSTRSSSVNQFLDLIEELIPWSPTHNSPSPRDLS